MEENMQAVGGILGNLKSMATDMGAEIEKQNSQLDRINDKVHVLFFILKLCLLFQGSVFLLPSYLIRNHVHFPPPKLSIIG